MAGYIKLHRGWDDNEVFRAEPFCERAAWAWLITNAAWKDTHRRTSQGAMVAVKRGQIHTSLRSLGAVWGWPKSTVERFISRLETGTMVTRETGHGGMTLTIVNYGKYQDAPDDERDSGGTQSGTVAGQSRDTQEEGKEEKEEKNKGGYAFCGQVVRLTRAHFAQWQESFPDIDLRASLQSRDDWLSTQPEPERKRWFCSTSSWLAGKQQEATRATKERKRDEVVIGI